MTCEITLSLIRRWNTDELVELYRSGGWWNMGYDKTQIPHIVEGSSFVVIAKDSNDTAVGFGRFIGDGISDGYLQDIVVFPEFRGQGIGSRIVSALRSLALSFGYKWIGLVSAPGKETFYRRTGFTEMKNYIPMLKEI